MEQTEITYLLIDGNKANKKPIAYCKAKKGYLTKGQLKQHRCLQRKPHGCCSLVKLPNEFWDMRKLRKQKKLEL